MRRPPQLVQAICAHATKTLRAAGYLLLAAACLMLAIALFAPASQAQISPGPLSKFHRDLDGPSGCTRCHAVSAGTPTFRCLECHSEIASRLRDHRGLHPALMNLNHSGLPHPSPSGGVNNTELNAACVRCHSEHNGESFALVKWNPTPTGFDHAKAGFTLDGKHAGLVCNQCHTAQRIAPAERPALISKNLARTYLGLSRDCMTCHEDKHRGQLGANCLRCHNTTDWKASRTTFDHNKTKYALRGAHIEVDCQKCHAPQQDGRPKYVGLKFDRCADCHSDPHRAAFPQQTCENCHNVSGWKQTRKFLAAFNHSKTKYPLLGKHVDVACQQCHRHADFKTAIAHNLCADCHKPDPHHGQFAKRADGGRCESCHTVDGFKTRVKFALAEHNATAFPLRDRHATVDCAKCHTPRGRATLYRIKFNQCLDCHKDIHGGQFARAPYMNRCEQCHSERSFHPATFTLALHQKSSFVLTGGHMAVACTDCHRPTDLTNSATAVYRWESLTCTSCHTDPHRNQFAPRMAKLGANSKPVGCEACHSTKSWDDLQRFDHASTNFALIGTHRAVECASCHRPPNLERKLLHVDFKAAPSQCEGCHDDLHGAQFARPALSSANGADRRSSGAPHPSPSGVGASDASRSTEVTEMVPCIGPPLADVGVCATDAQGGANDIDASTPLEATPGTNTARTTPSAFPGCADCHNTTKWRPSLFNHEKTAFSLKGAHSNVRCTACHTVRREVNDKLVLFYRPTPTACAACHGNRIATATGS